MGMSDNRLLAIAQQFAGLDLASRRAVYEKIAEQGLRASQFPIVPRPDEQRMQSRASFAQERQWFLWKLDPTASAYHISSGLRLSGELDIQAVEHSFLWLVKQHGALRTVFQADEQAVVYQRLIDVPASVVQYVDLSTEAESSQPARLYEQIERLRSTPFDLEQGPLLRVALFRLAENEYVMLFVMHHIISDGWSMDILVKDFATAYQQYRQTGEPDAVEADLHYADYALWQRQWMEAGETDRQLAYWRTYLGDEHPVLDLTAGVLRRVDARYRAEQCRVTLRPEFVSAVRGLCQREGVTVFMVLVAALKAMLSKLTGQDDIRVGVPNANRHRPELESLVGFFVNTQVLRSRMTGRTTLHEVLMQVKEGALGAQSHQDLPFEQLVEALQPERNYGVSPLFQVMYNHIRDVSSETALQLPGLQLQPYDLQEQDAQFDLTVSGHERSDGGLSVQFTYAHELFEPSLIEHMQALYLEVLNVMTAAPQTRMADVAVLKGETLQKLQDKGIHQTPGLSPVPLHHLFEQQVARDGQRLAVENGSVSITYAQLNAQANQLAHYLLAQGISVEDKIGVALDRSLTQIVALLAIAKAGAAFVPLDLAYPPERLQYMAQDSGLRCLLTVSGVARPVWLAESVSMLALDALSLSDYPSSNPTVAVQAEHLAYVMYTSGSTGQPKGVETVHQGVYRLVYQPNFMRLDGSTRMLQFAPITFDASTLEIWGALCNGGTLVQAPAGLLDYAQLGQVIEGSGVNTAWLTAALFNR
ncbi:condensation domain-containing protein, partial [Alcaligenes faecalis]|uniref:condensation domain-containing protein n=1 Tax=Alcaligenes faecalis TaxID=511 RepID=UPI002933F641